MLVLLIHQFCQSQYSTYLSTRYGMSVNILLFGLRDNVKKYTYYNIIMYSKYDKTSLTFKAYKYGNTKSISGLTVGCGYYASR